MSYEFITKNLVKPNDIAYGIDFSSNYPGIFGSLYDVKKQATANLKNLLLTSKGERYHNVTFGCDLTSMLFQPNVSEIKEQIDNVIRDAISFWLPYININGIDIITADDDPTMIHNIKITLLYSVNEQDPTLTSTILIYAQENGILTIEETNQ